MALSPDTADRLTADYTDAHPLAAVEREHLELLPSALESGSYGWRDVEWVVQWYYRRLLGKYPETDRRAAEAAFGENEFADVQAAITEAIEAETIAATVEHLTAEEWWLERVLYRYRTTVWRPVGLSLPLRRAPRHFHRDAGPSRRLPVRREGRAA